MICRVFKMLILGVLFQLFILYAFANQQIPIPSELVGTYSNGYRFGGLSLTLDSQGRYYIKSGTDTAQYLESGTYVYSERALRLTIVKKTQKNHGEEREINLLPRRLKASKPSTLIPLKWSDRIYLLDESELEFLKFCNAINLGVEPRKKLGAGDFLLRNGDEKKGVVGKPTLPGTWGSYLLSQSITATIIRIEQEGSVRVSKIVVIDKGSRDGLKLGMILMGAAVSDEEPTFLFDPKVVSVGESTARIAMGSYTKLKVGDRISTKFTPGPFYQFWATYKALQLTARQHGSQVTSFLQRGC